jgi:hypothetical protein
MRLGGWATVLGASALVLATASPAAADMVSRPYGIELPADEATRAAFVAKYAAEAAQQQSIVIMKGLAVAVVALAILAVFLLFRLRKAQALSEGSPPDA